MIMRVSDEFFHLNKKISFLATKEDLALIDGKVKIINEHLKFQLHLYRGLMIRNAIRDYKKHFKKNKLYTPSKGLEKRRKIIKEKYSIDDDICNRLDDEIKKHESQKTKYDLRNIECSNKNKKKGINYTLSLSVRITEGERRFIDEQVSIIREKTGEKISVGDFVRFCIREMKE